jgi:hypothetical protein
MDPRLAEETGRLTRSWMQHDERWLHDYLVAGVQDPRLNVQSILGRHFLIEALFGDRFAALMEEELRFATVMDWLLKLVREAGDLEQLEAVHHALTRGADDAEGLAIPPFILKAYAALPQPTPGGTVPNYIEGFLRGVTLKDKRLTPDVGCAAVFEQLWRDVLQAENPPRPSVIEAACGSANDYRCFESFGLARLIDYTGFDLCEKNIANARSLFPQARFEVRNVFETGYGDGAFDYCVGHDLLEHLSIEGMEAAVAELCRLTRRAICIGFFQMHEGPEHIVRRVDDYHINTLSLPKVRQLFARLGATAQAMHVNTFLSRQFGNESFYNDDAYMVTARF